MITRLDKTSPSTARVTKQREMEIEGEFVFKLETVELGINGRGKKKVFSCVVEPVDGAAAARVVQGREMTPTAAEGWKIFNRSMSKWAVELPPSDGFPQGVRGVSVEDFRREFYAGIIVTNAGGNEQDAKRQAFGRAQKALIKENILATFNGFIWAVRSQENQP